MKKLLLFAIIGATLFATPIETVHLIKNSDKMAEKEIESLFPGKRYELVSENSFLGDYEYVFEVKEGLFKHKTVAVEVERVCGEVRTDAYKDKEDAINTIRRELEPFCINPEIENIRFKCCKDADKENAINHIACLNISADDIDKEDALLFCQKYNCRVFIVTNCESLTYEVQKGELVKN